MSTECQLAIQRSSTVSLENNTFDHLLWKCQHYGGKCRYNINYGFSGTKWTVPFLRDVCVMEVEVKWIQFSGVKWTGVCKSKCL